MALLRFSDRVFHQLATKKRSRVFMAAKDQNGKMKKGRSPSKKAIVQIDYAQQPFFKKKAEDAIAFLEKAGVPRRM